MQKDSPRHQSTRAVRTIRVSDDDLAAILDKLDAQTAEEGRDSSRPERFSYRQKGCLLHMQQPGDGSATTFQVPTRDLSASGVSFLHGGYVHVGTRCIIQLISLHGTWTDVRGRVSRCVYVTSQIHDVGVKFDSPIQPGEFSSSAVRLRVLLADDDPLIVKLAQTYLARLNAEVESVADGKGALDLATSGRFDVVLLDLAMPEMDGLTAIRELRRRGFRGVVVALTANTSPEIRNQCFEAGFDDYIAKPVTVDKLAAVISRRKAEPLISSFHDDPSLRDLISAFLKTLPAKVKAIEEAAIAADWSKVELVARSLKGEGGSYGFDPISESAAQLETAAATGADTAVLTAKMDELVKWCRLAKGGATET